MSSTAKTGSWPETCPTCGATWKLRSKTMGAALGQPHQGSCINGHQWCEQSNLPEQKTPNTAEVIWNEYNRLISIGHTHEESLKMMIDVCYNIWILR